jgi:hypothetical protein
MGQFGKGVGIPRTKPDYYLYLATRWNRGRRGCDGSDNTFGDALYITIYFILG